MDASRGILSGTVDRFKTVNYKFKMRIYSKNHYTAYTSKYPVKSQGWKHVYRIGVN